MNKPIWFLDEIRRISEKRKLTSVEAEKAILDRIAYFSAQLNGDESAALEAYNLERNDCIDEDYFVEMYMLEKGVTEEVAQAAYKSLPF